MDNRLGNFIKAIFMTKIPQVKSILLTLASLFISNACFSGQITKSPNDPNSYKYLQLENGIKVILVSNPNAEKSAAALSVNVGSLNNPKEHQGLAHFLEHMLFLGTEKYPLEGEYQAFISSHGGSTNAYTAAENTLYMFDINPNFFSAALDRFSQFFIAPLFTEDLINREINAIDAEFNLTINDNNTHDWRILQIAAHPSHPFARFFTGNKATLKTTTESTLRDSVIDFYRHNYTPEIMTLSLESNQSLAKLEQYARQFFLSIKPHSRNSGSNSSNQQNNQQLQTLAFTPAQTGVTINVQPVGQLEKLTLVFPLPGQAINYKNQPLKYITNLISSTHIGSLYQVLRDDNLINSLAAGSFRLTNNQDILFVDFSLTKHGIEEVDAITQLFFSYLSWMQHNGIQDWMYAEAVTADIREFKFQEAALPLQHVTELADALRLYPAADILNYAFLTSKSKFSPSEITAILAKLTPDNMLRMIAAPNISTNQTENFYKINYKLEKLTPTLHELFLKTDASDSDDWALAEANPYLPINFSLKKPTYLRKLPTEILSSNNTNGNKLWFKQDSKFKLPLIEVNFILKTDLITANVKNNLRCQILIKMLTDALNTEASRLNMAGTSISYSLDNNKFIITINGYNDKIITAVTLAANVLVQNSFSLQRFQSIKEDLQDVLNNYKNKQLYNLAISDVQFLLYPETFTPDSSLAALEHINFEEIIYIKNALLDQFIAESFIYGNVSKTEAMQLEHTFLQAIKINTTSDPVTVSNEQYIKLPKNKDYLWFINPAKNEANVIAAAYQSPHLGLKARGMSALLAQLIQPAIFAQLRTKEQLGYVVGVTIQRHLDAPGLLFYVESPHAKSGVLLDRLETFLQNYQQTLANMSQQDFDNNKQALIHTLKVSPKTFTAQATNYFTNIVDGQYKFNSQLEIASVLHTLSKSDLLKFYNELLINNASKRRLLAVSLDPNLSNDHRKIIISDLKEFHQSMEVY